MRIAFCPERGTLKRGDTAHVPPNIQSYQEFRTAASLFRALKASDWDLAVVGWDLPDIRGADMLRWARATFPVLPPIVFLTRHAEPADIIFALDNGAVEYILAPVSASVLRARLDAILRITTAVDKPSDQALGRESPQHDVQFGQYIFHRRHHYVDIREKRINLRPKEYILALLLFRNIGMAVSRELLHEAIWGTLENFPTRALDAHICRLRVQLQLVQENGFEIRQIRGVGYRMDVCQG